MSPASHQTVRLSQGKHRDPDHGVCVMELASMLAGEPFSDRPHCACPVTSAFLRAYNDGVDDERRQDLYAFAAATVGSRSTLAVQGERGRMCLAWAQERQTELRRGLRRFIPPRTGIPAGGIGDDAAGTLAGTLAARVVARRTPGAHEATLEFLQRLLEVRGPEIGSAAYSRPRAGESALITR
jgi:hypothetical protein